MKAKMGLYMMLLCLMALQNGALGESAERKVLRHLTEAGQPERLSTLIENHTLYAEDLKVLERLLSSRLSRRSEVERLLREAYGIKEEQKYRVDVPRRMLLAQASGEGDWLAYRRLSTEEESRRMADLLNDRSKLRIEVLILGRLSEEQEALLEGTNTTLSKEFGVRADGLYYFDKKSQILYELFR